jgi:hypothetical protein
MLEDESAEKQSTFFLYGGWKLRGLDTEQIWDKEGLLEDDRFDNPAPPVD